MTKQEAYKRVRDMFDDEETVEKTLEELFEAIYSRPADSDDRETGLWSLICAGTPGLCGCSTRREHETATIVVNDGTVSSEFEAREGQAVEHTSYDGVADGILDDLDYENVTDLQDAAERTHKNWAKGYDGDTANITVTVSRCGYDTATF